MRLEDEIKQKSFPNEEVKAAINVVYTSKWLEGKQQAFFKQYGLTTQQFNALRILRGQHPDPCSVNIVKERMIDKMSDTSRLVDRLALKNLVDKHSNKDDKRAVDIYISQEGLNLLGEIDKEMSHIHNQMENLSTKELEQLNFLLDKLRG